VGVAAAHVQRVAVVMTGTCVRLRVTVFNASGLRSADWNGKSDPYVLGEIVGKPHTQFRTKTIERTLDPEWDEEKFVDDFKVGDRLHLRVMDEDNKIKQAFVGDDPLGSVILPSEVFYPGGFFGEIRLSDDQGNGEDAMLRLSIAVEDLSAPEMPPYGSTYGDPATLPRELYADQEFAPPTATLPPGAFAEVHPMPPTGTLPPSTFACGYDAPPNAVEQGACGHNAPPDAVGQGSHATFGSQVKRLRVVINNAEGLRNADWMGKSDPYCVCEVPGKPYTKFKTEVRSNTLEPVWNKQCDFDYTPGDLLEFSVFDKDIWPKSDDFLGRARLPAEHFYPNGFDGDLPLDDQGFLHISVMLLGGSEPRSQAHQARTPPRAEPRAPVVEPVLQVWSGEVQRLRITVVGARGVTDADRGTRCDLCCACEIPQRAGSGFRTRIASAAAGNPVWNHEQEVHEYFPGESLEFMILDRAHAGGHFYASGSEGDIVGSCTLSSERFFPFGFDAELTIFSPGQGIRGLLRVKVTVLDGPGMESRAFPVASTRSVSSSLTTDFYRVSTRPHSLSAEVLPITSASARGTELRPISASAYAPHVLEPTKSQGFPLTSFSDIQVLHRGEATNMSTSRLVQPISSTTVHSSGISAARVLSSSFGSSSGVAAMPVSPLRSMVTQPASVTSMAEQQSPLTTTLHSRRLTSAASLPISSLSSNTSAAMTVARTPQHVGSLSSLSNQAASSYVHQPRRPRTREEIVVSNPAAYSASSTHSGNMGVYGASTGQALPQTVPINTSPMPMTSIPVRLL